MVKPEQRETRSRLGTKRKAPIEAEKKEVMETEQRKTRPRQGTKTQAAIEAEEKESMQHTSQAILKASKLLHVAQHRWNAQPVEATVFFQIHC